MWLGCGERLHGAQERSSASDNNRASRNHLASHLPSSPLGQGTLVKRHRAPKEGGGFFGPADFAVGGSIRLYGRELHIIDADAFTRAEHQAAGMPLAPALPLPVNPIDEYKAAKSKPSGLSRADPDSPSKVRASDCWELGADGTEAPQAPRVHGSGTPVLLPSSCLLCTHVSLPRAFLTQFAEALLGKEAGSKRLQAFLEHSHEGERQGREALSCPGLALFPAAMAG